MRKRLISVLMIALAVCLLVAACESGEETTTTTVEDVTTTEAAVSTDTTEAQAELPAGWVVYEGANCSLALPDTFAGGDPSDPEVAEGFAIAEQLLGEEIDIEGYDLVAIGEPDEDLLYPSVNVVYEAEPAVNLLDMETVVDTYLQEIGAASGADEVEVLDEEIGTDRADLMILSTFSLGDLVVEQLTLTVLIKTETGLYAVLYLYDDPMDESLDDLFATSAQTIQVDTQL